MIDHARLAAMANGRACDASEILADFRRITAQDAALLREAVRQDDFTAIGILAHRIKGAGMMLGADHFTETCSLVSMAGRDCDRKAVEAALVFLEREAAKLDEYLVALRNTALSAPVSPAPLCDLTSVPMLCRELRFLVVEDHAFQRDVIIRFLRRLGALEVRGLGDGSAVLAALNAQPVDIMVLDLSMPRIDGMDLMRMLSDTGQQVSLILNSAISPSLMASVIQMAKTYRVNLLGAVTKPMAEDSLARLIAKFRSSQRTPDTPPGMDGSFAITRETH